MSLTETTGDIWSYAPTHRIVIPTNRLGVMGAGLALQAKQKYPGIQNAYQAALATMHDKALPWWDNRFPDLVLAPTKRHWRDKSDPKDLMWVLSALSDIEGGPFALPEMGCGLGGLKWENTRGFYHVFIAHFGVPVKSEWVVVHPPAKVKMYTGILR
jgi:hypothetical protein